MTVKKKIILIAALIILAALVIILSVGYFTQEQTSEYDGTLVRNYFYYAYSLRT